MECAVCFEFTNECVRPCGHFVCPKCVQRWTQLGNMTCPMCRQHIFLVDETENFEDLAIHPRTGTFFGVTVRNAHSGKGVVVMHLDKRDLMYRFGIRPGCVITHINGLPTNDHIAVVRILDAAAEHLLTVRLRVHRPMFVSVGKTMHAVWTACLRRPGESSVWTSA